MKNIIRALAAFFAVLITAGLILFSPSPATAADEPPPATVWQAWIMPNDGTDWPQLEATDANYAALPCGSTFRIQNDEYTPEERAWFVADGILNYQEDWGNDYQRGAISWFFTSFTAPDCIPDQPADEVTSSISVPTIDCDGNVVTVTTTTSTTPYIWDGKSWVPGETLNASSISVVGTPTAEECPVEEPPVVVPCETDDSCYTADTPTDEPTVVTVQTSPDEPILAATGVTDKNRATVIGLVVVGGLALIAGFALGIVGWRRRADNQ